MNDVVVLEIYLVEPSRDWALGIDRLPEVEPDLFSPGMLDSPDGDVPEVIVRPARTCGRPRKLDDYDLT